MTSLDGLQDLEALIPYMTPEELTVLDALLAEGTPLWQPLDGPQRMAFDSEADIIGYGGAAGGGKTDLIVGKMISRHRRCLVIRREKAQTEGVIQRMAEILGNTDGFNSQKSIWRVPLAMKPLVEFGGLDNPGDERRWQGRPHDLKAFDEVTEMREMQVRFIMGWMRSPDESVRAQVLMTFNPPTTAEGRWVIKFFAPWLDKTHRNPAQPGELRWFTTIGDDMDYEVPDNRPFVLDEDGEFLYDFDPADYSEELILRPKSRTFIPARLTDNPYYMSTGYMSTLQALPEPLRSQMLYGDFNAGVSDDPWQVIPTAWVEEAQARWTKPARKEPMDSLGVDVARGGKDKTVISRRHGAWYDELQRHPGTDTPDGPTVAGLAISAKRNDAPIHIDVIGVGSSPYDFLRQQGQQVTGVNVSEKAFATDKSGRLQFFNLRSQLWWQFREQLDPANNTGICLPPDPELLSDLCAPKWELQAGKVKVESREEIVKRIGRSPDAASAIILAQIETPKSGPLRHTGGNATDNRAHNSTRRGYSPYAKPRQ